VVAVIVPRSLSDVVKLPRPLHEVAVIVPRSLSDVVRL